MERSIYSNLKKWKESLTRKPLILQGARQVGKTYILKEFGAREYSEVVYINCDDNNDMQNMFVDYDVDRIIRSLSAISGVSIKPSTTLLIIDEIQEVERGLASLKYFCEKAPEYHVAVAGSLLGITLHEGTSFPVGKVDMLYMYPMDFEEFRWAMGDEVSIDIFRQMLAKGMEVGPSLRSAMRDLRLYMLVGGMPQAVNELLDTNNLQMVDKVKRNIINLYNDDLLKVDSSGVVSRMFLSIPSQLSRNASKYSFSSAVGSMSENKMAEAMQCLEESKVANVAYNVKEPSVGMGLTKDNGCFKIYTADTGLFVTLAFWDKDFTENIIYQKLLSDKLSANLGYVYENLVAQMLVASGNSIYYHTWAKDEKHSYEVDFLISRGSKVCPIEVKSSGYKTHASLDAFCNKYSDRIGERYLIYTKDYAKDGATTLLPVFMTPLI